MLSWYSRKAVDLHEVLFFYFDLFNLLLPVMYKLLIKMREPTIERGKIILNHHFDL